MFRLFALCAATIVALTVAASAETLVERGGYLVNAVMGCDGGLSGLGREGLHGERG